jgi:transposase
VAQRLCARRRRSAQDEPGVGPGPNWTLARLIGEIEAREGVTISKSRLSKVLRKKNSAGVDRDIA